MTRSFPRSINNSGDIKIKGKKFYHDTLDSFVGNFTTLKRGCPQESILEWKTTLQSFIPFYSRVVL